MKKIKHLKDIEQEKMRLRIQQLEQEKAIRKQWIEIKEAWRPGTLLRNKLSGLTQTKPEEGPLFSRLMNHGVDHLSRRFTEMAGKKLETSIQEGIKKMLGKKKAG